MTAPAVPPPEVPATEVQAPEVAAPAVPAPEVQAPEVPPPEVPAPEVQAPEVPAPEVISAVKDNDQPIILDHPDTHHQETEKGVQSEAQPVDEPLDQQKDETDACPEEPAVVNHECEPDVHSIGSSSSSEGHAEIQPDIAQAHSDEMKSVDHSDQVKTVVASLDLEEPPRELQREPSHERIALIETIDDELLHETEEHPGTPSVDEKDAPIQVVQLARATCSLTISRRLKLILQRKKLHV